MDIIKLTHEKLDVANVNDQVMTDSSTGATSIFIGTTRDNFQGKMVVRLEYEAFVPMAEKEIKKVCSEIRQKWKEVHNIMIIHKLGMVEQKEASIIIAITSKHRKDSLEAVHFAIDELKAKVPIWKKEIYANQDENCSSQDMSWKENKECSWSNHQIQIKASKEEIDRRINSFIQRKREEIDQSNIREFCNRHDSEQIPEYSCARTDSIVIARQDSSSHLRKSKVLNMSGPSAPNIPLKSKSLSLTSGVELKNIPEGIDERLSVLEGHIAPGKPVPKNIYERIKALEDRVLFLEGISPEYFKTKVDDGKEDILMKEVEKESRNAKISNSLSDINIRIQELQSALSTKTDNDDDQ